MKRPNVVFILCDQMKATASHLYGNPDCRTPALGRLADSGVMFEHAITPHPLCVPARGSLMTGLHSHTHGSRRNETWLQPSRGHIFELWHENGYRTGLIGKNHCIPTDRARKDFDVWCEIGHSGLPEDHSPWGMEWYRDPAGIREAHELRRHMPRHSPRIEYAASEYPLEDYSTGLIAGQTERFLEQYQNEPFALWVSFPDPHTPYEAPKQYSDRFPPGSLTLPPRSEREFGDAAPERNRVLHRILGTEADDERHVRGLLGTYYAMVAFIDDAVDKILRVLDDLGLREETIVVFTSDHGDFSTEHGMVNKGGLFYDCLTRVPLIVSWPGRVPEGRTDSSMANLVDIAPTLLALQGLDAPWNMHGRPLPTVTGSPPRSATFSEYGAGGAPFRMEDLEQLSAHTGLPALMESLQWREAEGRRKMVRTTRWKYVHDPCGDLDELYDLQNDPWELRNIACEPGYGEILSDLQFRLMEWSILTEDLPGGEVWE